MLLELLIPQFNETETDLKDMLNSLESQHQINFNDFHVIIGNDGSETKLSEEFLSKYSFPITYVKFKHSGVSGTRQHLLEIAKADYVMFCDADDMFYSNLAIKVIMDYIRKGFDILTSTFVEEQLRNGSFIYIPHKNDRVFVHGKVYNRQFLLDNQICWHEKLIYHEDSCFNIRVLNKAQNKLYCKEPFYLWKWNDNSVCRRDELYILKTYVYMIASTEYLVNDLLTDDSKVEAAHYASAMVYNTYYELCKSQWLDPKNEEYRTITEIKFKQFYEKCYEIIKTFPYNENQKLIKAIRGREANGRSTFEPYTFDEWIRHILNLNNKQDYKEDIQ